MAEGLSSRRGPEHSHFLSRFFSGGWERGVIAAFISAFFSFFLFFFAFVNQGRKEGAFQRRFIFLCVSTFPRRLYGVPPCSVRYTNKVLFGKHYKLPCMELLLLNIF